MAISRAQMKSQLKGNKMAYERKHSSPVVEAIGKFVRKRKAKKDSAKARKANEKKVAMQRTIRSAEAKRRKVFLEIWLPQALVLQVMTLKTLT